MSFLARMNRATSNVLAPRYGSTGINGHGLAGFAVDKSERWGAALAFGAVKGYYRDRAVWRGYGADAWVGGGLTLASAVLQMLSGGRSEIAPHLDRVGDAGVMSYLNSMGAAWGNKKAGRVVQVLEAGRAAAQLPAAQTPVLGAIPPVAAGAAYLTADEIAHFTSPR